MAVFHIVSVWRHNRTQTTNQILIQMALRLNVRLRLQPILC